MSVYLDASVLVSLFAVDSLSVRADAILRARAPVLLVSDFAAAEFASAMARRVRMQIIAAKDARAAFATFDVWVARATTPVPMTTADIKAASAFLRGLDLTLRTPDALHIAIAQRLAAELMTFDKQMTSAARTLGTKLVRL